MVDTSRVKLPFGIAQVGKSFRNEINPRNFTFRSREFEQMEIEFFCQPDEAERVVRLLARRRGSSGTSTSACKSDKLRLRDHDPEELAFYSTATADIEYVFPFGVSELEGIAHRGDYDLTQHQKFSGKDLSYFDEETQGAVRCPHVDRAVGRRRPAHARRSCARRTPRTRSAARTRTVLKFHPRLAPVKAAVFPLVKKDGMPEKAEAIYRDLKKHFNVFYDEKGAVGRRYRRQDEAGTPFCITVDGQTPDRRHRHVPRPRQLPAVARPLGRGRPGPARPARGQPIPGGLSRPRTAIRTCMSTAADPSLDRRRRWPSDETLHQPGDDPEHPVRGRPAGLRAGGWPAVELWLTKLETYLETHTVAEARALLEASGLQPAAAAGAGGLLLSRGAEREAHWDHFRRRLGPAAASWGCRRWSSPPTSPASPRPTTTPGPPPSLAEAAELAAAVRRPAGAGVPEGGAVLRQPRHHARPDRPGRRRRTSASASTCSTTTPGRASSRTWPT